MPCSGWPSMLTRPSLWGLSLALSPGEPPSHRVCFQQLQGHNLGPFFAHVHPPPSHTPTPTTTTQVTTIFFVTIPGLAGLAAIYPVRRAIITQEQVRAVPTPQYTSPTHPLM